MKNTKRVIGEHVLTKPAVEFSIDWHRDRFCGKVAVITGIDYIPTVGPVYKISIDYGSYWWSERMIQERI